MSDWREQVAQAVDTGQLLGTSASNIAQLLSGGNNPLYQASVEELVARKLWAELNDRFFKTLAFGTGGLRGRTIGKVVTAAEQGDAPAGAGACPQFPCVGTNALNFYNVSRATQGLVRYLRAHPGDRTPDSRPSLAIAHDTRHFSRAFAEYTAKVASENGCDVYLFAAARSTPELSFAVRHANASAGVVITASHNPPHDNGFKVYSSDGAQVVEPDASGIIQEVNQVEGEVYRPVTASERGKIAELGPELDGLYKQRLRTLVLRPEVIAAQKDLKIVFTAIHGTGGEISVPLLRELGFQVLTVPEQDRADGAFPTVKSPNPENVDALSMGVELARRENADLVLATDPDADRMGVACRNRQGQVELLTGNQIGSLLAWYRIKTLKELGVLTPDKVSRAVIIKTFVTTDLQKVMAEREGLRCVETLTGFKYVGAKLKKYEQVLPELPRLQYRSLTEEETRRLRLEKSTFFVFGGEESYGYSGADFVRDKDANSAVVMFAEVAAYAKSERVSLDQLLDRIYLQYGYYTERTNFLQFEGAEGAAKIKRLVESYKHEPPTMLDRVKVARIRDFSHGDITDVEGDLIPKENMLMVTLEDGRKFVVRPSGTEPKMKFYLFARREVSDEASLPEAKGELAAGLDRLWEALRADADSRAAS
ncbi:MAG: phospho-sugar mutase [Verrucomicrobia bacterium]|nr:phospho-sugar mutase [Verrucomicrobiota bacterium]